jgi:hypothetical protein
MTLWQWLLESIRRRQPVLQPVPVRVTGRGPTRRKTR